MITNRYNSWADQERYNATARFSSTAQCYVRIYRHLRIIVIILVFVDFVPQKVSVSSLSEGVPTAGNVYTLRCIVNRVDNFNSLTMLEGVWLNAKNDIITSNTDYIITGDASTTSTSLTIDLTFTKLKTSHGGTYSCSANMTIPDVVTDHQVNITTSVIVGSKLCTIVYSIGVMLLSPLLPPFLLPQSLLQL